MSTKFKKGEQVQARWAGSKKFYDGKIVEVLKTVCKVQFENDGTISSVKLADIKKPDKNTEETSTKSNRSKTRNRSRSTGRETRSRSKSKSPARKTGRPKRSTGEDNSKTAVVETEKSSNVNSVSKDVVDSVKKPLLSRETLVSLNLSPIVKLNSYFSSKETTSVMKAEATATTTEGIRSKRLSALRSMESTQRQLESKFESKKLPSKAKYSDDDEEEEEEDEIDSRPKQISKVWQTAYFLSTLLKIFFLPAVLLFLIFACTTKACTILEVPPFFSRWSVLVNSVRIPMASVIAFHLLLCLLPLIPLGKKVLGFPSLDNKTPMEYRLHGLVYLVCSMIIFGVCAYFGINMNWGIDKFKPIALSSFIYCAFFSFVLYIIHCIKGHGSVPTKVPFIGKFYSGSVTNPVLFGKIDVKTSFVRAGLIGSVLLNSSILMKYFLLKSARSAIPLGLTAGMQILFALHLLFCEEKLLSTYTYTSDTVGYAFILTTGFLVPFGLSAPNVYHYLYETKTSLTLYWYYSAVAVIVVLFLIGYYIFLTSSNLKHNFRRDPYGKAMLKHDSVPTQIKSKRLLLSGGWGLVRHPNYLGLLIMAIAWTLPCGFTHAVPYGPLAMLFVALVFRIFRIEKECSEKYGPGWKNYTEKVRSRLIPYIF